MPENLEIIFSQFIEEYNNTSSTNHAAQWAQIETYFHLQKYLQMYVVIMIVVVVILFWACQHLGETPWLPFFEDFKSLRG